MTQMNRTNIYLSTDEQTALDARAAARGTTRSEVIREILDRELNLGEDAELDRALIEAASEIADRSRQLSRHDPDLSIE